MLKVLNINHNQRGNMNYKILVTAVVFYMYTFCIWAFPVYDVGSGFLGFARDIDKVEYALDYAETDSVMDKPIRQNYTDTSNNKEYKTLWQCYDPYYIKYTNQSGSVTYWKTSELHASVNGDDWGDASGNPQNNKEYQVMPIDVTDHGVLLFDRANSQYVYKLDNGLSFPISGDLSEHQLYRSIHYKLGSKPQQWVFTKHDTGSDFRLVVVNFDGSIPMNTTCNQSVARINRIYCNLPAERYLVDYSDEHSKRGLLILSNRGTVIKNHINYNPGNAITFYDEAEQYVTTRNEFNSKHVIDLKDGEINAEIKAEHLDLAEVNGSLMAVVSSGRYFGVVSLLDGIIIHDMSDFRRDFQIEWVRIKNEGTEVVFAERSRGASSSSTIKHLKLRSNVR